MECMEMPHEDYNSGEKLKALKCKVHLSEPNMSRENPSNESINSFNLSTLSLVLYKGLVILATCFRIQNGQD
jgi:hypothetical protein